MHPLRTLVRAGLAALLGLAAQAVAAPKIEPTEKGLLLQNGEQLRLTFAYPKLTATDGKPVVKLVEWKAVPGGADLKYERGAEATLRIDGGRVEARFRNVPPEVRLVGSDTLVNYSFATGGLWQAGRAEPRPFPETQPAKPHLFQGNVGEFTIHDFAGKILRLTIPDHSYLQITDNREWGWKIFAVKFHSGFDHANPVWRLRVSATADDGDAAHAAGAGAERKFIIDRFGQEVAKTWPGKLSSEDELRADIADDEAYYASLNPPAYDRYGGLPGSGERLGLRKTGFFHVEQKDGRWYLVNPEGNATFYKGVSCFGRYNHTYVAGRESIYEWLPSPAGEFRTAYLRDGEDRTSFSYHDANVIRKYGRPIDAKEWMHRMIGRARALGFNGRGAFSAWNDAFREAGFPYVATLPVSEWNKHRIHYLPGARYIMDPWDERNRRNYELNCAEIVAASADDPLLIGYYLQNEPLYEDIPRVVPGLDGRHACKRELVKMLEEKYGTIARFNAAWGLDAESFDALRDRGLAVSTPAAREDIKAFTGLFLEEYYKLTAEVFRKYDPNHMLVGSRLQYGTINNEQLCRIMGRYVDVVSFNYYTYAFDSGFLRRIHDWTGGKPMLLSEFYWNSPSDSGLPGGVKDVASQQERGLAYRNYVEKAAALPFVVGVEWFQLVDQSRTGNWFSKYNGENGNCGLFSAADRPHKEMLAHMVVTNREIHDVIAGRRAPFSYDNPRFMDNAAGGRVHTIQRAHGPIVLNGTVENSWPGLPYEVIAGGRLVQGASADGLEAAYKTTWDDEHLYLHVKVSDRTPMRNKQTGANLWMGDGVELFIGHERLEDGGPLLDSDRQILLGAGLVDGKPQTHVARVATQPEIRTIVLPEGETGYVLQAAIPWSALGFKPKVGDTIRFDIAIDDSEDGARRLRQLVWNGTEKNSGDRGAWGRARLN